MHSLNIGNSSRHFLAFYSLKILSLMLGIMLCTHPSTVKAMLDQYLYGQSAENSDTFEVISLFAPACPTSRWYIRLRVRVSMTSQILPLAALSLSKYLLDFHQSVHATSLGRRKSCTIRAGTQAMLGAGHKASGALQACKVSFSSV